MLFNQEQFKSEISGLKKIPQDGINPIRKAQLRQSLLSNLDAETIAFGSRSISQEAIHKERNVMKYAVSTLIGLALIGGTAFASGNAKPGDALFPIKKATEKVRLALTVDQQAKADLQVKIAQDRLEDVSEVDDSVKEDAKVEAETEVDNAVSALSDVETKLQAKGNTQAAAAVHQNIIRLQADAKDKIELQDNEDKNDGNDVDQNDTNQNENQNQHGKNSDSHGHNGSSLNISGGIELDH